MGSMPSDSDSLASRSALFWLSGIAGSDETNPTSLTNPPAISSLTIASERALPSVPYQRTDAVFSCWVAACISCSPSDSKLASSTATLPAPRSEDSSAMRSDSREAETENSADSGLYLMPSSTVPPRAVKCCRMAASRPSPHASPRQTGTNTSMPSETASRAATPICVFSFGTSRNTPSPGTARDGAVEQHPKITMSLASAYPFMLRMLELVSGPLTMLTSLE